MHNFPRSHETRLHMPRESVERRCPGCGSGEVAAYRVLSEGGWWDIVKCQDCLESLERNRAPRLGVFQPIVGDTLTLRPGEQATSEKDKETAHVRG